MQITKKNIEEGVLTVPPIRNRLNVVLGESLGARVKKIDLQNWVQEELSVTDGLAKGAIVELLVEVPKCEKKMMKLYQSIEEKKKDLCEMHNLVEFLEKTILETENEYRTKYDVVTALVEESPDRGEKIGELHEIYAKLEGLKKDLNNLQLKLNVAIMEVPILQYRLTTDYKEYENKLELIEFLGQKVQENKELHKEVAEALAAERKVKDEDRASAVRCVELTGKITTLEANLLNVRNLLIRKELLVTCAKKESEEAQRQITTLKTKLLKAERSKELLVTCAKKESEEAQRQITTLKTELLKAENRLVSKELLVTDAKKETEEAEKELATLRQSYKDVVSQSQVIQIQLSAANAQLDATQNVFGLLGGIGFGYMVFTNPEMVTAGVGLFGREVTVAGLDQMMMGYGMQIATLVAGFMGYLTSLKVGPLVAVQALKLTNAVLGISFAMAGEVPGLLKVILIKLWEYRNVVLALFILGYLACNAEMLVEARYRALLLYHDMIDLGIDEFTDLTSWISR